MVFDINSELILDSIMAGLETAGSDMAEEKFNKICNAINEELPGVIALLTQGTAEDWKSEAINAGGWGTKYAPAVKYEILNNKEEIFLDESIIDKENDKPNLMFAMMMEKGVKSWSIKDALMKSEKVKIGKDGIKYIIIPFPVRTPRKNTSMNAKSSFGGREMTNEIHAIVKGGGRMPIGTTLNVKGKEIDIGGLTRYNTRKYHSQYGFFRCVTANSTGWQYPDVPAEPIFPKILNEINRQISEVLSEFCKEIVKEYSK